MDENEDASVCATQIYDAEITKPGGDMLVGLWQYFSAWTRRNNCYHSRFFSIALSMIKLGAGGPLKRMVVSMA